jgi:hypothetical protein
MVDAVSLLEAGQYAVAISAIMAVVAVLGKWLIVNPLKAYIKETTYPIQVHANGGKSLPDAIAALNRIESRICDIDERLVAVENHVTKPATRTKKATV